MRIRGRSATQGSVLAAMRLVASASRPDCQRPAAECAPTLRGRVVDSRDAPPLLPLAQSWQPPGDRSHITFAPDPGPRPAWLVRLLPVLRRQPTGGACQAGDLITGEIRTSATCEESPADGSEELTLGATLGSADLQVLDDVRTRGAPSTASRWIRSASNHSTECREGSGTFSLRREDSSPCRLGAERAG